MDDMTAFERMIANATELAVGPPRPVDVPAIVRSTSSSATSGPWPVSPQRLRAATVSLLWRSQSTFSATRFAVAGVVVALLGGFLLVAQPLDRVAVTAPGAETDGLPPLTGPAANGLMAFSRDGDIYVGDPETGESEVIVAGPETDSDPIFSPDGTHIAFMRVDRPGDTEDLWTDADIVVVRADGSDERVVTLERPFGRETFGFEWTPDSRSLVSHHDIPVPGPRVGDYLLDAAGVAEPILLPYTYGSSGSLRPPDGDRVLGCPSEPMMERSLLACRPLLADMDRDGSDIVDLGAASGLDEMGYHRVDNPTWSPDASRILFEAITGDEGYLYVMNADGSDLRRLVDDRDGWSADSGSGTAGTGFLAWSPDSSTVAEGRVIMTEPGSTDHCPDEWYIDFCGGASWVTLIDVVTGARRDLHASYVPEPTEIEPPPAGGSSWSPDGRSILRLRELGGRPDLVDIETDTLTELPWESDSTPSWQRVAAD